MTILLQRCAVCGQVQYPRRDVCGNCLSDDLPEVAVDGRGRLIAEALLHSSLEPAIAATLPLRIGTVALDAGPHLIAMIGDAMLRAGAPVTVVSGENACGQPVLIAEPFRED